MTAGTAVRPARRRAAPAAPASVPPPVVVAERVTRPPGLVRRALAVNHHFAALAAGGLVARVRARRAAGAPWGPWRAVEAALAALVRPLVRRDLRDQPFAVQLRRRLELLGPTYIKLGQILSLREDLLPRAVTDELKHLLDGLPAEPFGAVRALVERELGAPLEELFLRVDEVPFGSASIAQIHRATTRAGDAVVLKVVKPGVREILRRDARLLRVLGAALQRLLPAYQPGRIIREFVDYTLREADLRQEADAAETFAANFADTPDVHFPVIYPELSGPSVLCMEYVEGLRPDTADARALPRRQREKLVDLGAGTIIRMIYRDGFFHADLHPGNLRVLPGARIGFLDLGMIGRLDADLRRSLLYYYYSLVTGDAENAARYLAGIAVAGAGSDPAGFRREVTDVSRRWRRHSTFEGFSLGQLILDSLTRGARYRMYFPVELVLMVKALITFEGVGHVLLPGFNVADVSRRHIREVFIGQLSPVRVLQDELRQVPELVDSLAKLPLLVTEGVRALVRSAPRPAEHPFAGVRGTILAGFLLVAGAILLAAGAAWPVWAVPLAGAVVLGTRLGRSA